MSLFCYSSLMYTNNCTECCYYFFAVRRFKGHHRQLLIECSRDVEDGMKRLEDESAEEEEESYVR